VDYSKYGRNSQLVRTDIFDKADVARLEHFINFGKQIGIKFWWTSQETQSELEIFIIQMIGNSNSLCKLMKDNRADKITIRLSTTGGDYSETMKIIETIKALSCQVNVVISGLSASACSIIAMAGHRVLMASDAFFQIHGAYRDAECDPFILLSTDACNKRMAGLFYDRTGIPLDVITAWMEQETIFTADEALELGFIDEIIPPEQWLTKESMQLLSAANNSKSEVDSCLEELEDEGLDTSAAALEKYVDDYLEAMRQAGQVVPDEARAAMLNMLNVAG
jgi:ATP-dependent protease ClpP protease subunit